MSGHILSSYLLLAIPKFKVAAEKVFGWIRSSPTNRVQVYYYEDHPQSEPYVNFSKGKKYIFIWLFSPEFLCFLNHLDAPTDYRLPTKNSSFEFG